MDCFTHAGGKQSRTPELKRNLLAVLLAHSTLADECELGRIAADVDADSLALSLIGAGHLLFAGRQGAPTGTWSCRQGL
ncbi:hypothetical protein MXD63_11940 [Frankia sp. Cpl3]|nr:hypothetical protein [Frankia sp. Cpl3]